MLAGEVVVATKQQQRLQVPAGGQAMEHEDGAWSGQTGSGEPLGSGCEQLARVRNDRDCRCWLEARPWNTRRDRW